MTDLAPLDARVASYATASHGAGTRRSYRSAWHGWLTWCQDRGEPPLPTTQDSLARWAAWRADSGCTVSTIRVGLAAIRQAHRLASEVFPAGERLDMALAGITRTLGVAPTRQASAASPDALRAMLSKLGVRDRALVLLGYGGALRRSEIVALDVRDVVIEARGVLVTVRRSKGDQTGAGVILAVARGSEGFCAAEALETWLAERGSADGALFTATERDGTPHRLIPQTVARIVATAARRAGLEGRFSGHSLRAGMITAANKAGAQIADTSRHARHKRIDTTMGYIRAETAWDNPVSALVFGSNGR